MGKGSAIKTGLKHITGDIIIIGSRLLTNLEGWPERIAYFN